MTQALTDRTALTLHRRRAAATPALFLHELARDDLLDRRELVKRTFTAPAVVTPFPQVWQGALPNLRVIRDSDVLDLEEGAHDLVFHALALHWADDPVGQLVQCRRALKPDGLFLGALFGGQTLAELRACMAQAESALTGGLSPRVLPMGEIRDLGALLQRAGLALPVADSQAQEVSYRDMFHLIADLRGMGETNALAERRRTPSPRALFTEAALLYQTHFPMEAGRVRATFEMIFLAGWAPDESQPKPLRPGSAAHRLADALGVEERPLPRQGD